MRTGAPMSPAVFLTARSVSFAAAATLTWLMQRWKPHARVRRSPRVNVVLGFLAAATTAVACGACALETARRCESAGIGVAGWLTLPTGIETLIVLAILDLASYVWHRANHTVPLLWRFHQVHHSDDGFTVSTGIRFHPGELLLSLPVRLSAIVLAGAGPAQLLVYESVFAAANLFEHGDVALPERLEGFLGRILVLPAHHRRHHSRVGDDMQRNFGTIFILWDRALASFRESRSSERVEVGLCAGFAAPTLGRTLLLPIRESPRSGQCTPEAGTSDSGSTPRR